MPTADTVHTIFNGALDIVAEIPAASISEDRAEVRWLVRNYSKYVQAALRRNVWNFACELHSLNQNVTAPAYRWTYAYDLPPGWLRVLPITYRGDRGGLPIVHEVRGNQVLANYTTPFPVELVMDRQDPGTWDPLFARMIEAQLALGMAHRLTRKNTFVDRAKQMADAALEDAELINAVEGSFDPQETHDVIRVRSINE